MPVTTEVRVRYAETDQMGVVYYANYYVWFEIGRVEVLRSVGLSYKQLEIDHSLGLPVIESHCRYRSPARYDDEIVIETCPSMVRGSVIKFDYKLFRKPHDGGPERELLAEGHTVHVVCDSEMKRKHLPQHYVEELRAMMHEG